MQQARTNPGGFIFLEIYRPAHRIATIFAFEDTHAADAAPAATTADRKPARHILQLAKTLGALQRDQHPLARVAVGRAVPFERDVKRSSATHSLLNSGLFGFRPHPWR